MLNIQPSGQACGATVTGVDLRQPASDDLIAEIRSAWVEHQVLAFPDQPLTDAELVRFTQYFGEVGDDPFFESISDDNPVFALTRKADEKAPVFAENWHSDWSFKEHPPIGTCLLGLVVPPVGGDTGFANQQMALAQMPDDMRKKLEGKRALHSAGAAYAPDGFYGDDDGPDRSMKIVTNESAREVSSHTLFATHPESGKETIFSAYGYIIGIEDMEQEEAHALITELYGWQTQPAFQYQHKWAKNMLVLWDNRSVLHRAYGGYDGYDREMHRTTIAGSPEYSIH